MQVTAIQTPLVKTGDDFFEVLSESLIDVPEETVLVITSKIISVCEGRVIPKSTNTDKHQLARQEAEYYLEPHNSRYNLMLTINNNQLFVNAGIDESNVENSYVLWPTNLQEWANEIWLFLREEYDRQRVGVIISDSKTSPLHWGVTGASLAHAGFVALNSKIGKPDLYGQEMKMTQVNVAQALAVAGVLEMGEANEQTPLALIQNVREIVYQDRVPSSEELDSLKIALEDDLYAPLLTAVDWQLGGGHKRS